MSEQQEQGQKQKKEHQERALWVLYHHEEPMRMDALVAHSGVELKVLQALLKAGTLSKENGLVSLSGYQRAAMQVAFIGHGVAQQIDRLAGVFEKSLLAAGAYDKPADKSNLVVP